MATSTSTAAGGGGGGSGAEGLQDERVKIPPAGKGMAGASLQRTRHAVTRLCSSRFLP